MKLEREAVTTTFEGRTPHGVRGLKSDCECVAPLIICRTPHGVRGLKLRHDYITALQQAVAPRTGCVD